MPDSSMSKATNQPEPKGRDRRKSTRSASGHTASVRPTASMDAEPVEVRDVSSQGLGLLSSRRFEQGSVLVVELGDSASEPVTVIARVVRLQRLSDGKYPVPQPGLIEYREYQG